MSEKILDSKNKLLHPSDASNNYRWNIQNACLLEFIRKYPNSPLDSAKQLYKFLNVFLNLI